MQIKQNDRTMGLRIKMFQTKFDNGFDNLRTSTKALSFSFISISIILHYENTPMQYTENKIGCKNEKFH